MGGTLRDRVAAVERCGRGAGGRAGESADVAEEEVGGVGFGVRQWASNLPAVLETDRLSQRQAARMMSSRKAWGERGKRHRKLGALGCYAIHCTAQREECRKRYHERGIAKDGAGDDGRGSWKRRHGRGVGGMSALLSYGSHVGALQNFNKNCTDQEVA